MRQNDESILETIGKLRDVVEMDVPITRGALLMSIRDERALDDEHFRLEERSVRFEDATIGVAGVKKQRLAIRVHDLGALAPKIGDVIASGEFGTQPVAHFEKLVGPRGNPMRRAMATHLVSFAQRNHFSFFDADDLDVVIRPFDLFMQRHQRPEILGCFARHEYAAARNSLQMALAGIERNAQRVIEMTMRDEDMRHADRDVGTASDVEHHAELAHAYVRLVSRARASLDREVLGGDRKKIFISHPFTIRAAVQTKTITTSEELAGIFAPWLELWREQPTATPFQSPMWLLPWWRHFGSNDLNVIATRDGARLRSLAPLYVIREDGESLGMFLGTGISDYLDILGTDPPDLTTTECQMWDLQQLRSDSPLLRMPLADGWTDNIEEQDRCVVLSIENAGEALQNLLSTHFRKKLRYYQRSLDCTFEDADAGNLDALLDALFELHAARWQRRGMPGMLADDVIQQFHREVARAMLDAGALRMHAMRSQDRIVAVFYGFAHRDTVSYYLSGYDPALEKHSPGTLIVAHAIEKAVREGATTFDFLRGAEDYKYSWGAKDRINYRRQITTA